MSNNNNSYYGSYPPSGGGYRPGPRHGAPPPSQRKPAKRRGLPVGVSLIGIILLAVSLIVLFAMLLKFNVLPSKWMIIAGAACALLLILLSAGSVSKNNGSRVVCFILALLFTAITVTGCLYFGKALQMLDNIRDDRIVVTKTVSAVVLSSDPAQGVGDTAGYTYGILGTLDRATTNNVLQQVTDVLGSEPSVTEYPGCVALASALYNGDVSVILLNEMYRELLLDNYPEFTNDTRILQSFEYQEIQLLSPTGEELVSDQGSSVSYDEVKKNFGKITEENDFGSFIVYLTGIDTYGSTEAVSRSDVNILAVVNPRSKEVALITTPRDSYVELPMADYSLDKLTHAALYGGVESSMATLGQLYDVSVDYYVRLNFTGFSSIVDALGGINVWSDYDFVSNDGYSYSYGDNYLNGEEALSFVRERYAFSDGDFQRGRNQMAAIKGIMDKITSPAILTSYMSLMDSISDCFSTNFTNDEIASLVRMQLEDNASWNITSYEAEGYASSDYCYSIGGEASTVVLYDDTVGKVQDMIRTIYDGGTLN